MTVLSGVLKGTKGVTLVELIMAMVILSVVALPMGSMIGAQIQGMMDSTDFTTAGNLARGEMERLNNIPYASITNNSSVSGSYTVSWTVATAAGGGGAARKDITMTAKRTGTTPAVVTLYGTVANNVTYAP
jgi:prepilin-type N-terminal cleavage/methylation domain-containing protein